VPASFLRTGPGGQSFVGPDAVRLYQAIVLRSALRLFSHGIKPGRGYTLGKTLAAASAITGKPYARRQVEDAREDLRLWAEAMRERLPLVERPI
jgi:hypothetical protein